MTIELITGRAGVPHVGSEDARAYHAYTAGDGRYVLHGGGATVQSANDIHINPAEILVDGAHIRITGTGEDVTIDNGASSYQRIDIVALHYVKTGSEEDVIESVSLEVVKGTPSDSDPVDPDMPATGNLLDNVSETYIPYIRIRIDGLIPQEPESILMDYSDARGLVVVENDTVSASVWSDDTYQQRVAIRSTGDAGDYALIAKETGALDLYDYSQSKTVASWDYSTVGGLFKAGRGMIDSANWESLYNLAPGSYILSNTATNSPVSGSHGNMTVSRAGGNRVSILVAFDNGQVWTIRGAQSTNGAATGWRQLPSLNTNYVGTPNTNSNWWMYRKYEDGKIELWGRYYVSSYDCASPSGAGVIYFGPTLEINLPFNVWWSVPNITVNKHTGLWGVNLKKIEINKLTLVAFRTVQASSSLEFCINIRGYWKDLGGWG